jgi:MFS transporter, ACS family, D-galactonate transporter
VKKDGVKSWVVILLVGLALTLAHSDRSLLAIAAPGLIKSQHVSGTRLGILLSAFSWTYTAAQLPSGWLVDRFGPRAVLASSFVGWSLVCAATGLTAAFASVLVCRVLLGLFEAPLFAVAHATMAQAFSDRRRALPSAIYAKGVSLGPALGALLGSYLLLKFGWSGMFVLFGLGSLLFVLPWLAAAPPGPETCPAVREHLSLRELKCLLGNRAILGSSVGYFGFLYLYYIYATWLPTYLAQARGLTTAEIAWMYSATTAIALVAGPASGLLTDWMIGRGQSQTLVRKSMIGAGLLLSGAVVLAAFTTNATRAALLFVIALAGESIAVTNMLALPSAIAPAGRAGLVGSFQQCFGALAGIVSPLVTGMLYDRTHDFKAAILCAAAMLLLAAVSFLLLVGRIEQVTLRTSADPARCGPISSPLRVEP